MRLLPVIGDQTCPWIVVHRPLFIDFQMCMVKGTAVTTKQGDYLIQWRGLSLPVLVCPEGNDTYPCPV
jgi:hypothetical protein